MNAITKPSDVAHRQQETRKRADLAAAQREADVRWIMEHAAGRRFVAALLDQTGVDLTTFTGNSDGHRLEGRRQIGLEVQDEVKQVAFDNYIKMLVEKRNG